MGERLECGKKNAELGSGHGDFGASLTSGRGYLDL